MKLIAVLASMLVAASAHATPGDIGCSSNLDGQEVDVLIGYDHFDQGASLVEVSIGGKKLFSGRDVKEARIDGGMVQQISASDASTQSLAMIRIPEQGDVEPGTFLADLSLFLNRGSQAIKTFQILCEY